ncbi:MAG TPA: MerR family transcriptional regulator [Streptosporangiaceae bacterium]
MAGLTIGKFAATAGVSVETVRFYQRRGLLPLPERQGGAFREYTEGDQARLAFIRRAGRLGFTLSEISDLLGPAEARSAEEILRAAEAKITSIENQIRDLTELRGRLRRLVQVCEHGDGADCVALHLGQPCCGPPGAPGTTRGEPSWAQPGS